MAALFNTYSLIYVFFFFNNKVRNPSSHSLHQPQAEPSCTGKAEKNQRAIAASPNLGAAVDGAAGSSSRGRRGS